MKYTNEIRFNFSDKLQQKGRNQLELKIKGFSLGCRFFLPSKQWRKGSVRTERALLLVLGLGLEQERLALVGSSFLCFFSNSGRVLYLLSVVFKKLTFLASS